MSYLHEWRPDLSIAPSRALSMILAIFHMSALGLLPFANLANGWTMVLTALLLLQWFLLAHRYARLTSPLAVTRILWMEDGWMLETQRGMHGPYRLSPASRVNRHFLLLHFRRGGLFGALGLGAGSVSVPVVRDNVGNERFHLLQIFMRWQRPGVLNPDSAGADSV